MNPLQRTIIEKTGNDNGFEHVVASDLSGVTLASARHANRVLVGLDSGAYQVRFQTSSSALLPELQRSFPATQELMRFRLPPRRIWPHCCAVRPAFLVHCPVMLRMITSRQWPQNWRSFLQGLLELRSNA